MLFFGVPVKQELLPIEDADSLSERSGVGVVLSRFVVDAILCEFGVDTLLSEYGVYAIVSELKTRLKCKVLDYRTKSIKYIQSVKFVGIT